jgi:hypothetical protein
MLPVQICPVIAVHSAVRQHAELAMQVPAQSF